MEEIIHQFGIDARLVTIQVINIAVLVGLLSYFLYKPLLRILDEREAKIKQGLTDAEAAATALENAEAEKKTILTAAQKEAEAVSARATAHAKEQAASIVTDAEERATTVVKTAEEKSAMLKAQALKESEQEIAKLAILASEKILREKKTS